MAKAEEIAGLECSAEARVWAPEVLRGRFDEIVNLRRAVLDSDDIEALHNLRVATRRLRSALRDFAPVLRKRPLATVSKDLKKFGAALGAVRDLDVALSALEKLRKKTADKAVKAGIGKLIDERRANRERAQADLMETLAASAIDDLRKRFYAAIEESAQKKNKAKTISFTDAGRAAILKTLHEFCDLSASLYAPHEVEKLHKLRICAKRLRYTLELFTACWGAAVAPFAEEVSRLQTYLGKVHDADEWIKSFSRRLLENDAEISPANLWLLSRFVKLRAKNYRNAIELWSKWKAERFIEKLSEMVSGR
jgi:CHAD domain-containing protein